MSARGRNLAFAARATLLSLAGGVLLAAPAAAEPIDADEAEMLSAFGERASFSPDGRRIAFVGKAYGDAYEIDLATRQIRNLTRDVPHQGIVRIQFLPDGSYLVTAPQRYQGPDSRGRLEMWTLDKELKAGLQPLAERPLEGIAVSRARNLIAWTAFAPGVSLGPKESWMAMFAKPTRHYVAEIVYRHGTPQIANKREIMSTPPEGCGFVEPQDFRDSDRELVFSCLGAADGKPLISVMGYHLETGRVVTYRRVLGEYNEVEGIAPDGSWATVECGTQDSAALPPLDICALDMKPDGQMRRLVVGTKPGSTAHVSNPVVSPDGKRIAFQKGDATVGEAGEGMGLYLADVR
jgi:Tol biopolymer transport system component